MEIDLYTDLAAFNALTPEEQEEEAERLRAVLAPPEPPPKPPPRPPLARVMVAPAPAFEGLVMADTPGSVILRAEDILPEEDELESEPEVELKVEPEPEPEVELKVEPEPEVMAVPIPIPEPAAVFIPEPQPVYRSPESTGRKVKMDDQQRVSGPLVDVGFPAAKSDSGLIVCPVCNSRCSPQDLFCIGCGSFLNEPDTPEVELVETPSCSDCGASVEPGEIFCPSCGSSLPG